MDSRFKSNILIGQEIMKKIYLFAISIAICLSGCDLDRLPETKYTDADYWKSETDLRFACNRMYSELAGFYFSSNPSNNGAKTWHDSRSDELARMSADAVSSGSRSTPATSLNDWEDPYTRIFTANNIIDKAYQANVDEKVLNRYLAEAYFFRSYHYFMLVRFYGDAPHILKSFDDPEDPVIYSPRTSREIIIQKCYEDLKFAAQWLPTRASLPEKDWGRVTRSAALAMIARIGLYEGTYGKYHSLNNNYKNHLKESIDATELLMKEGHKLYGDFQKLFTFDGEGPNNLENIFVKVYGPNGAGTTTHSRSRGMENTFSVTRQMVDMFLYTDGLPREKSSHKISPETSFNDVFANRDPRLAMSVFQLGEEAFKGAYVPFVNQHGYGYSIKKGFIIEDWGTVNAETVDNMVIRYGNVLVDYAEALYEHNEKITDDQLELTINALRGRVNFGAKLTNDFVRVNGLDMLQEIRRERVAELLDEGSRYDDLIRWKKAQDFLPRYLVGAKFVDSETTKQRKDLANRLTDANGMLNGKKVHDEADMYVIELEEDRRFKPERDYLYPIPTSEIAKSKGSITENNPNW